MNMKFIISGKSFDVSEALKDRVIKKLGKLDKFFNVDTEAHVTMSVQKNRHILEVTIPYNGITFRAEVASEDMYSSIDKAGEILERQIRKNRTRLEKRLRTGAFKPENFRTDISVVEETDFDLVRTKRFTLKPMPVEEAILQMNLLGHEFFVFLNAETNDMNVVYRRKDGDYGLIEPDY